MRTDGSHKRAFRFSIRALLALTLISAVVIAILVYRTRARLEAIKTLRSNGAIIQVSQQKPSFYYSTPR